MSYLSLFYLLKNDFFLWNKLKNQGIASIEGGGGNRLVLERRWQRDPIVLL